MTLIDLVIWLGVIAIVVIVGWFLLSQMQLPEPIRRILIVAAVIVVAVLAIVFLLQFAGTGGHITIR